VPAVGGWTVVAFFGHPDSSAAPAKHKAIDTILFIYFSINFYVKAAIPRLNPNVRTVTAL
jgi:hypothetical protein